MFLTNGVVSIVKLELKRMDIAIVVESIIIMKYRYIKKAKVSVLLWSWFKKFPGVLPKPGFDFEFFLFSLPPLPKKTANIHSVLIDINHMLVSNSF